MSNPKVLLDIDARDKGSAALDKFGAKIQTVGKIATTTQDKLESAFANAVMFKGLDAMITALQTSTELVGEFSKELAVYERLSRSIPSQTDSASKSFRTLALSVEQSSVQVAQAANMYQRMGKDAQTSLALLPVTMDLITAGGGDVEQTLETVATAMNSFKIGTEHASWAMNQLFASAEASMQTFPDLAEGFKEVGPVAASLGLTFHETNTLLGMIAESGLRGERGGTALKNMLVDLLTPTGKVKDVLKGMNLEGKRFIDVAKEIGDNTTLKETLETLGLRSLGPVEFLSQNMERYEQMSGIIDKNKTQIQETADALRDSLGVQLEQTGKLVRELGINFVDAITGFESNGTLDGINAKLRDMNKWLMDHPESVKEFAKGLETLGKATMFVVQNIEPLVTLLVTTKLFDAIKIGATSVKVFSAQMKMLGDALKTFATGSVVQSSVGAITTVGTTAKASAVGVSRLTLALRVLGNANLWIAGITGAVALTSHLKNLEKQATQTKEKLGDLSEQSKEDKREMFGKILLAFDKFTEKSGNLKKAVSQIQKAIDDLDDKIHDPSTTLDQETEYVNQKIALWKQLEDAKAKLSQASVAQLATHAGARNYELRKELKDIATEYNMSMEELVRGFHVLKGQETLTDKNLMDYNVFINVAKSTEQIQKGLNGILKAKEDLSKKEESNLKIFGDLTGDGKSKKGEDPTLRSEKTWLGLQVSLSEELLANLKKVKDAGISAQATSVFEVSYKQSEGKKGEIRETIEKERDLFNKNIEDIKKELYDKMDSLTGLASEMGTQGTEAYLNAVGFVFEKGIPELTSKLQGFGEITDYFNRLTEIKKSEASLGAFDAFSVDSDKTKKALEPLKILGLNVERSSRVTKVLIKDLESLYLRLEASPHTLPEELAKVAEKLKEISSDQHQKEIQGNLDSINTIYESSMSAISTIYDAHEGRMQERHDAQLNRLTEENELAVSLAGDNAIRRGIIEQEYMQKKAKLDAKQLDEKRKLAKKQQAIDSIQALISTGRAAIGAAADTPGDGILRGLAAASMVALGLTQVAMINSQKFALGSRGTVRDGRGNSDLIPTYLSEGEVVTERKTVDDLGGYSGFKSVIDQAVMGGRRGRGGDIHYHIGEVYGSEQYIRSMFKKLTKEGEVWQY